MSKHSWRENILSAGVLEFGVLALRGLFVGFVFGVVQLVRFVFIYRGCSVVKACSLLSVHQKKKYPNGRGFRKK